MGYRLCQKWSIPQNPPCNFNPLKRTSGEIIILTSESCVLILNFLLVDLIFSAWLFVSPFASHSPVWLYQLFLFIFICYFSMGFSKLLLFNGLNLPFQIYFLGHVDSNVQHFDSKSKGSLFCGPDSPRTKCFPKAKYFAWVWCSGWKKKKTKKKKQLNLFKEDNWALYKTMAQKNSCHQLWDCSLWG